MTLFPWKGAPWIPIIVGIWPSICVPRCCLQYVLSDLMLLVPRSSEVRMLGKHVKLSKLPGEMADYILESCNPLVRRRPD